MADLESVISGALEAAENGGDEGVDTATGSEDTAEVTSDASDTADTSTSDTGADTHVEAEAGAKGSEATADAKAVADATKAVEDAFAKEHGLNPLDQRKKENRIPYSQVKKITANAEKKLAEAVLGTKFAADKPLIDQVKAHATRFTEIEQENQGLKTQLSEVDQVEQIMLQRPEQFLQLLPHINPKFAELLAGRGQATRSESLPATTELPKPDMKVKMPDGTEGMTYSTDGVVGLIKAVVAQTRAELQKGVDDRLKPLADREAAAQTDAQILNRLAARVNHARENWKGFKDWEKEIQDTLRADREQAERTRTRPKLDLQDAYIRVRDQKHDEEMAKLKTDREKMRADIVKEINGRPKSTAAAPGAARRAPSGDKPKTMEDIIKAAVDEAGV